MSKRRIRIISDPAAIREYLSISSVLGDRFRIGGRLYLIRRFGDGPDAPIADITELGENLIVNTGRDAIVKCLVGTDHPNNTIGYLQLGNGATGPSSSPNPPVAGDTTLGNVIRTMAFATVSFPSTGMIRFSSNLSTGTGNGEQYNEAGLITVSSPSILVARKTFGIITKSSAFAFEFRWEITCTAV